VIDRAELDRDVAALREELQPAALAAAWAEGRSMSVDQAIELGLAVAASEQARSVPDAGPAARLTARELAVAELIARGLTNRRIADELVITKATADRHVSNILSKLGMATRAQVASWMTQQQK